MTQKVPLQSNNKDDQLFRAANAINELIDGKVSSLGEFTLNANQTTTTVVDRRVGINSVILPMPTTANAAAAVTSLYVSTRGKETFTATHDSDAATDRTFAYVVLG